MLGLLSFGLLLSVLQPTLSTKVYLNPQRNTLRPTLSPSDASSVLSHHLGLELFESFRDSAAPLYENEAFVGQGAKNALLVTMEEYDAEAILPSSLTPSFKLSTPSSVSISSLYSVISTYLHRARHAYSSVYEATPSLLHFENINSLKTFLDKAEDSDFAALDLSGLAAVRKTYGSGSEEFTQAASTIRAFLERGLDRDRVQLAILTYTPPPTLSYSKRQSSPLQSQIPFPPDHAPPQEPIGSVSTCFATEDTCNEETSTCSGRGQCVQATKAGKTCYVCACGVTTTGEGNKVKTQAWVGESCERRDVSGPFVLLAGTVIVIILLGVGSVSLLFHVGNQELPSTLMGGAVNSKKE
ncbi:hypothetical protein IW261DRAFT_1490249 [Armillaria novae-zelandiae]|uniref:Vacuolar sorting protein Vps3844 C-terminal domain-containing protein n=1 Tax=Armillaria novae-zelandiae TaxID=153914 RepID=A0AA39P3W8_9AGAR|nr:hypothetical protein IW261DRAFT_1490249 [Armillaria novae-zelandiae]